MSQVQILSPGSSNPIGKPSFLKEQLLIAILPAFLCCITLIVGAAAQVPSAGTEVRAIQDQREAPNNALKHRDLPAFAASLDADFVMIRGNGVLVPTRRAYFDLLQKDFADPASVTYQRIHDSIEVSALSATAPLAAEHGHWQGTRPDGSPAYGGTYLAMWRKTPTGWKLRSELYIALTCADGPACNGYRKP